MEQVSAARNWKAYEPKSCGKAPRKKADDPKVIVVEFKDAEAEPGIDAWEIRKRTHPPLARFLGLTT